MRLVWALLLGLAFPACASAGVAELRTPRCDAHDMKYQSCRGDELHVDGAGAERNVLTVRPEGARLRIRDAATPLRAGRGCVAVHAHEVVCANPGAYVDVDAGDGDDEVRFEGSAAGAVRAGRGADVVTGGSGPDVLNGGPGRDTVSGGDGDDRIGDGDAGGPASSDVLDGGPGTDLLGYADRRTGVTVDLAAGVAGAPGEGDRVAGFENVEGGTGDDRLLGDDGPNALSDVRGRNLLAGRGGDDRLAGSGERSRYDGGAGSDAIDLNEQGADAVVVCGPGRDRLDGLSTTHARRLDRLSSDCEDVTPVDGDPLTLTATLSRPSDPVLRFVLDCLPPSPRCVRTVTVRTPGGTVVGRARVRNVAKRPERAAALRLSGAGRALLGRRGRLDVTVEIHNTDFELHTRFGLRVRLLG